MMMANLADTSKAIDRIIRIERVGKHVNVVCEEDGEEKSLSLDEVRKLEGVVKTHKSPWLIEPYSKILKVLPDKKIMEEEEKRILRGGNSKRPANPVGNVQ